MSGPSYHGWTHRPKADGGTDPIPFPATALDWAQAYGDGEFSMADNTVSLATYFGVDVPTSSTHFAAGDENFPIHIVKNCVALFNFVNYVDGSPIDTNFVTGLRWNGSGFLMRSTLDSTSLVGSGAWATPRGGWYDDGVHASIAQASWLGSNWTAGPFLVQAPLEVGTFLWAEEVPGGLGAVGQLHVVAWDALDDPSYADGQINNGDFFTRFH